MALIEQAVFTSAETDRSAGYQIVAASPGLGEADLRELAAWGPSHGSLVDSSPDGVSFNFHPLKSGRYCVSRTTSSGWEYSGRGAARVYTQCLVLPGDELARFANNPFAVLRAALAGGALEVQREVSKRLEPLQLSGRSPAVDSALLARLSTNPGPRWLATIVTAVLARDRIAIAGSPAPEHVIAGLINCLPPECRTEFSFSTGLKCSSRRAFRIVTAPDDPAGQRRIEHQYHAAVLDLGQNPPAEFAPIDGWSRYIEVVLKSHRTSSLATQFSKRRFALSSGDLPALGLQLLEEFDAATMPAKPSAETAKSRESSEPAALSDWLDGLQRAHAAHRRFKGTAALAAVDPLRLNKPSEQLSPESPELLEKLELLDDLVFAAIDGNADALAELRALWPKLHDALGDSLLAESREQYLRHALFLWQDAVDSTGVHDSAHAIHALDVLCVLFDG
ncbi:MAG: hypothetical protein NTW96_27160 [Planctomycetia bacterium]|nr:hypothetical protein [Planctomycetia bacterium]